MIRNKRAVKVIATGQVPRPDGSYSRLPVRGDELVPCCSDANKVVADVDVVDDDITYTDGTHESLYHCGWDYPDR